MTEFYIYDTIMITMSIHRKGTVMSLQLVLGNAGVGKSRFLFEKIIQESMEHPEKNYLILVPEQFTMQIQKEVVSLHPRKGIFNIDILSFERLAYRILADHEEFAAQILEETGKSLVLRKVAQEKKGEFTVLGSKLQKTGYISQMKSTVSELMQYDVDMEGMQALLRESEKKPQLYYKLKDIAIMYQGFKQYLEGSYVTAEEVLDILCKYVPESPLLRDAILVLDGYTGFTPIQGKLLGELLQVCEKMYVSLTLDEREKRTHVNLYKAGSPHQLFYLSRQTIENLCQLAAAAHVEIEEPLWISHQEKDRFVHSPSLAFLERHLFRYDKSVYEEKPWDIHITACQNPQEEMRGIAVKILQMVREEGYQYKDFAVITGDMEAYGKYAAWAFAEAGIPCFLDEKHSVLLNPFIECIRSLVDIVVEDFSYESVFRYLRCGMTDVTPEETDLLENYCIALGIRGFGHWKEEWVRHYRGQNPEEIAVLNGLREKVIQPLLPLLDVMKQRKFTVREGVIALYQYVTEAKMEEKLEEQRAYFEQIQEMALEKEYSQVYAIVIDLFDKMVDVLGEEKVSRKEWKELLEAGLAEAKVGIIPPSSDQVLVGDMERTRLKDLKVLFFAGVNENRIPKNSASPGLLSDLDRETLKSSSVSLAPTARENLCIQRFYLYLALTKPQRKLYLSYSKSSEKGDNIGPAFVIASLQQMFPKLEIEEMEEKKQDLEFIQTPQQGIAYVTEGFHKEPEDLDEQWRLLYQWYCQQAEKLPQIQSLLEAAFYENPQDVIGKSAAHALYGKVLENSATRLERFAACAFAHFMEYGMQARERERYEFKASDLGNVVHEALEIFSRKLHRQGISWREMQDALRDQLIQESVAEVTGDYGNTILHSTARNEYMIQRVTRILSRTVWAVQKQIMHGKFEPHRFEVAFSMADSLESVQITLSEDEKIRLKGRLDRLDICEQEDQVYIKVVDYKSGNTAFDLVALYHGLQLQLVLYMNAAVEMEQQEFPDKHILPAGIFYYHVEDPMLDRKDTESAEEVQERLIQKLRPDGLVLHDGEAVQLLDVEINPENNRNSSVIPVAYNKDGSFSKTSKIVSYEQFQTLGNYVNKKVYEIGRDILDGKAQTAPYSMGTKDACTYCPYKGICGFDEKIPGYQFRRLKAGNSQEIWDKIKKEVNPWE